MAHPSSATARDHVGERVDASGLRAGIDVSLAGFRT
jgi:hypothetical protein